MLSNQLVDKLRDPEYRAAFVASQINFGIPFQLRALLKARGKTQEWLAEKAGMLQPRISGLLSPGKTRPNIETLRRLAEAFDCGLAVRFVPFSELASWSEEFDPESFNIPSFDQDLSGMEGNIETNEDLIGTLMVQAQERPKVVAIDSWRMDHKTCRSETQRPVYWQTDNQSEGKEAING
jgi:transcriptional regulator with XRE-family HTH domain